MACDDPALSFVSTCMNPDHDASPNESDLVRRARHGDEHALARLYGLHARAVHALAFRLTGNKAAAEDITQDTFLKMLRFLGGFRGEQPLRPWLKRVASNAAIDHLRREWRFMSEDTDDFVQLGAGPMAVSDMDAVGLLRRLAPPARTVVWLHVMEGWTHPEIGARFGRSQSWSKSILARSLAHLREYLEEQGSEHS